MATLDAIFFVVIAVMLLLLTLYITIYPKLARRNSLVRINPLVRPRSVLVDWGKHKFGAAEILEAIPQGNGMTLTLKGDGNREFNAGPYLREELQCQDIFQVMCDEGAPTFVYSPDGARLNGNGRLAILEEDLALSKKECNDWKSKYYALQADMAHQIEEALQGATEVLKAGKPTYKKGQ